MEVYFPQYYHDFRCLAGACPDSCCKEWTVDVDHDAASRYRALPGDLGDRLRSVLRDEDGGTVMVNENGRCPMWQQDGLCHIQAQLGHDALCKTCREYPRLRHDYGDFVELGLELSCPEAARLILCSPSQSLSVQTVPGGSDAEYDPAIMEILRRSRDTVLSFLESADYTLPETLAAILLYSHSIQAELDGDRQAPFDPAACLTAARGYARRGSTEQLFAFFQGLEILTEQWRIRLQSPAPIVWTPHLKALARYMIQRYWLQAVSDWDLVCRVKLAVASCLLVGSLGGDPVQTAQLFSKEIENDPDNVGAILDGAYCAPALTDSNLLGLLLT